jgi:hypothetical protein
LYAVQPSSRRGEAVLVGDGDEDAELVERQAIEHDFMKAD